MRPVYTVVTLCGSVICLPVFLCFPRGRRRVWERYGGWRLRADDVLWFHGASVGEVAGMLPIMERCRAAFPDKKILLTATSPTGLERAGEAADYVRLLPFDHPFWISLALRDVRPRIMIFGETEIWPNLLAHLRRREVPVLLVNGRLSEFSLPYYRFLAPLMREALRGLQGVYALNEKYRERFIAFGADENQVVAAGNAKYESKPSVETRERARALKTRFFAEDLPVLVLGSLRPGEDEIWFPVIMRLAQEHAALNIVVAPRHQEKFSYFIERLERSGVAFRRWSQCGQRAENAAERVIVLDTLGELEAVYSFADGAFVGGTLVRGIGGHNPLEAAAYGAAVALGPHCENIDDIAGALDDAGALCRINGQVDAEAFARRVGQGDPALRTAGVRARQVWEKSTGAAAAVAARIEALL